MTFFGVMGTFGVAAAVLFASVNAGWVDKGIAGVLAVVLVLAGIFLPFYSAHHNAKKKIR